MKVTNAPGTLEILSICRYLLVVSWFFLGMLWLRVELRSIIVREAAFTLELSLTDALFSRRADAVELEKLFLLLRPPAAAALDGEGMNSLMMKLAPSIDGVFFRQGLVLEGPLAVLHLNEPLDAGSSVVVALLGRDSSLRSLRDSS